MNALILILAATVGAKDLDGDGLITEHDAHKIIYAAWYSGFGQEEAASVYDPVMNFNANQVIDSTDMGYWLHSINEPAAKVGAYAPWGDVNTDGAFNSTDLVQMLARGQYEDGIEDNSRWGDGDVHLDWDFRSDDLVFALSYGLYEYKWPRTAVAVPEPASWKMSLVAAGVGLWLIWLGRRK
jgi:hypothetical protein